MITLNTERGFEQVETWEEILELPGFKVDLDPGRERLKEIIGRYIFREKIPCGLSVCRQPHGRGYIVTTESGKVTNIGNVCGKNHFGVKFDEYSKIFRRALLDHQNREAIASFQLDKHLAEISKIRCEHRGADWVYRTTRALVERNRGCPDIIVSEIGKMVRGRSGEIRIFRLANEEEAKELEVYAGRSLPRPQYIEEAKGLLRGIECLYHEYNIREILILDVEPHLAKLGDINIDEASSGELKLWAKWCQEYEEKLERVRNAVSAGRVLLKRDNLEQLAEHISDRNELASFENWLAGAVGK